LRSEVFGNSVFELAMTSPKILRENFGPATCDPADASLLEAFRSSGVVELRVIRQVHELGNGQRIELQLIAVAVANRAEEIAIIVQRKMRIEASVERRKVAAQRQQFVKLGKDLLLREHVSSFLPGQFVEGAVVALCYADVGVVHDAHHHVGATVRGMEARPHLRGEAAHLFIRRLAPQQRRILRRDALLRIDLAANIGERGGRQDHPSILNWRGTWIPIGPGSAGYNRFYGRG
jgi:hypothetical protein